MQSIRRSAKAIGAALTPLAYFTFTPALTVTFPSTPAFSITDTSNFSSNAAYYIGIYSTSTGWITALGPSASNGATVTFPALTAPTTFTAGYTYTYVFFSTASVIPTPSPTPTSTPVAAPLATAGPPFAYLSLVGTNTFASAISASSHYGYLINVSTPYITTASASAPNLSIDSTLAVKVGTNVNTFADARTALSLGAGTEHPSADRAAPTLLTEVAPLYEHHDSVQLQSDVARIFASATRSSTRSAQAMRRAQSLGTTVGSTSSFWVNTTAIGQAGQSFTSVAATLGAVSSHGYIWVDNSLSLSPQSIATIGTDFDNAYASDVAHFGTPEYTSSAPGAQALAQPCDSSGVPVPGATPGPVLIAPPNGMHVVLVVNPTNTGSGIGGYFSGVNHFTQQIANCLSGQPKSNEASMIFLAYNGANSLQYELQEDMVRDTGHEFQHLINFVNHGVLLPTLKTEDLWINEGLSMLAQDFAVHAMYPSVSNDVDDAVGYHAVDFLMHPTRFSLTGFTGLENGSVFSFNCTGCYGASYLYQRYLYDRFGGDTYSKSMESNGNVSIANIQAASGVAPNVSIADFAVALMNSGTGISLDPRYMFANFNPYGTYVDQFGQTVKLQGPYVVTAAVGQTTALSSYVGTFNYVQIQPTAGQGAGVTVYDPAGTFGLKAGLLQF